MRAFATVICVLWHKRSKPRGKSKNALLVSGQQPITNFYPVDVDNNVWDSSERFSFLDCTFSEPLSSTFSGLQWVETFSSQNYDSEGCLYPVLRVLDNEVVVDYRVVYVQVGINHFAAQGIEAFAAIVDDLNSARSSRHAVAKQNVSTPPYAKTKHLVIYSHSDSLYCHGRHPWPFLLGHKKHQSLFLHFFLFPTDNATMPALYYPNIRNACCIISYETLPSQRK